MMKNILRTFLLLSVLYSCGNPCDDIDCGLNGTCVEDSESCLCDQYYEGTRCELEVRAKYLGTKTGTGLCESTQNPFDFTLNITPGVEVNEVVIQTEQLLQGFSMSGMLDANNDIVIPEFMAHVGSNLYDGKIVDLGGDQFEFTLTAYVAGVASSCVLSYSK